jgi:hypothetical protein
MRRNPYEDYHDAMQVCLNGHFITDSYYDHPDFRKRFCTSCGAETIHKCPNCAQDIKGRYVMASVIDLTSSSTPVPKLCEYCGKNFPWGINEASKGMDAPVQQLDVDLPKIDDEKKKNWIDKIAQAESKSAIQEMLKEPGIGNQPKLHSQLINLSARWSLIEETRHKGLEDIDKVFKIINQINDALVKIIHELK